MNGIFTYDVVEMRESADHVTYVVECKHCSDHEPCRVLIAPERNTKRFIYVETLNDDDSQYYWHVGDYYFPTMTACAEEKYKSLIENLESTKIEAEKKFKETIKICDAEIDKVNEWIEVIKLKGK